jgi:hypothetical protein
MAGLQKAQVHVLLNGLKQKASKDIADPSQGLSVCENFTFNQDASPELRLGYCLSSVTSAGHKFTVTKDGRYAVSDVGHAPMVTSSSDDNVYSTESSGLGFMSGVTHVSPERITSLAYGGAAGNDTAGTYASGMTQNSANSDIYYYSDYAVVVLYCTELLSASSTYVKNICEIYLIDTRTGIVTDVSYVPNTYDYIAGATNMVNAVRVIGYQSNLLLVIGPDPSASGTIRVLANSFGTTTGKFTSQLWTIGASYTDYYNVTARAGLIDACYDESHSSSNRMYIAYHTAWDRVIVRQLNTSGSTLTSAAYSSGGADPGDPYVVPFGIRYTSTVNDEIILLVAHPGTPSGTVFCLRGNNVALSASSRSSLGVGSVYQIMSSYNSLFYLAKVSYAKENYTTSGGVEIYGIVAAISRRYAAAVSSLSPITYINHFQIGIVGNTSTMFAAGIGVAGTVPMVDTYTGYLLAGRPFTVGSGTAGTHHFNVVIPLVQAHNAESTFYSASYSSNFTVFGTSCLLVGMSGWTQGVAEAGAAPLNPPLDTKTYPYNNTPAVVGSLATGKFVQSFFNMYVTSYNGSYGSGGHPRAVRTADGSAVLFLCPYRDSPTYSRDGFESRPTNYALYKIDTTTKYFSSCRVANTEYVSCGYPTILERGLSLEAAFPHGPFISSITPSAGAGSVGTTAPNYMAIFQYENSSGDVVWSEASPIAGSSSTNKSYYDVNIFAGKFRLPGVSQRLRVLLFRSEGSGAYYNVGSGSVTSGTTSVLIRDSIVSSSLSAGLSPYYSVASVGSGGPLPRQRPASLRYMTIHRGRIFGVDEDGDIRFTNQYIKGEAVWWSDAFTLSVPSGEFPTGLASVDGRLLVFTKYSTYVIDGDGPPESGGNGTEFSAPVLMARIGCIDGRSIAHTPEGAVFRSSRGLEMVDASCKPRMISDDCQDTLSNYPYTTGAVYSGTDDCVKFMCTSTAEGVNGYSVSSTTDNGGAMFCYYIGAKSWSVHKIGWYLAELYPNLAASSIGILVDPHTGQERTTFVASYSGVMKAFMERRTTSSSRHYDGGTAKITGVLESNEMRLGNASNSRERVYECEFVYLKEGITADSETSPYQCEMILYTNYSGTAQDTVTIDSSYLNSKLNFVQLRPSVQQVYSARLRVTLSYDSSASAAPINVKPLQMAFNVGVQDGFPRLAVTQRGG